MSLIGKKAPQFEEDAVINGNEIVEKFSLEQFIGKRYVLLFFYPMDFTYISPTEIITFQNKLSEFEKRNCVVVACSIDSKYSHYAWLSLERDKGGLQGVTIPLIADTSKTIAMNFGVLGGNYDYNEEEEEITFEGNPFAYRGLFLIDRQGVVRHQLVNDIPIGCSVDESLRILDALRHYEKYGEGCPADWEDGQKGIEFTHEV